MKFNSERLEKDIKAVKQVAKDNLPVIDFEQVKQNIQSIPQVLANGFKKAGEDIIMDVEDARNGELPKNFVSNFVHPKHSNQSVGHILAVPLLAYVGVVTLIGRYTEEDNSIKEFEKREIVHRIPNDNIQDVTDTDFVMVEHSEPVNNQNSISLIDDAFEFEIIGENSNTDN